MFVTPDRYAGKVAITTGGATGIGRAIVERVVAEGGTVVVNDLNEDNLAWAQETDRVLPVVGDIGDPATSDRLVAAALEAGGRIDAVFNNAGIVTYQPAESYAPEDWDLNIRVNLNAHFQLAQRAGRVMIEQRSGAILNVASGAGLQGIPFNVAYVATKHGVIGITRALAVEWARYGIRVNALCPGFTESPLQRQSREQSPETFEKRQRLTPLHRPGRPEEQAAMAVFLNSDESSYTTGLIAVIDSGNHTLYSGYEALPEPTD